MSLGFRESSLKSPSLCEDELSELCFDFVSTRSSETMSNNHKSPLRFSACEILKQDVLLKFMP